MKRTEILPPKEEEILCLLWDNNAPMTTMEIAEEMMERGWSRITVFKTIQSMTENGTIEVTGVTRVSKSYARQFWPTFTKNEYFSSILHKRGFSYSSFAELATTFFGVKAGEKKSKKIEAAIKEMERIVEEVKREEEKESNPNSKED